MTYDPQQPPAAPTPPLIPPPAYPPPQYPYPPQGQYIPGYYAPGVLPYSQPVLNPRPTSATVLSIIGIVLGSLWILLGAMGALQLFAFSFIGGAFGRSMSGFQSVLQIRALEGIAAGLIGVGLLIASIALLRLAGWARRGMILVAIVDMAFILLKLIVELAWSIPMQERALNSMVGSTTMPTAGFGMASTMQMLVASATALVTITFPVLLLVFMCRNRMKQAYDGHMAR